MRAIFKIRGLTLLLRVRTLWRCGDGLFFEVPPSANDAILTTLHPLLENVLQTVDHFEISYLGAPFSRLEKPRNRMGRDLECMADVLMGFHRSTFSKPNIKFNSDLTPCDLISGLFQPWKWSSEARNFEVINGLQHVFEKWVERCKKCIACQGRYFEQRPSPHLHKVPTRSNNVSPRTLRTVLVYTRCGYDVPGMILLQAWYMYTHSLLRGVIFEALPLSSYALSPVMLPLFYCGMAFSDTVTFFACFQYPEIFVPLSQTLFL
jgi:hypothetical protein